MQQPAVHEEVVGGTSKDREHSYVSTSGAGSGVVS